MKTKSYFAFIAFAMLLLAMLACALGGSAKSTATPTAAPTDTTAPTEASVATQSKPTVAPVKATKEATSTQKPEAVQAGLTIVSQSSYKDSGGNFHVVGELKNGETKALTNLELTITIKDASGKSLLKDDNDKVVDSLVFWPMLGTLAPGESSPFDYFLSLDAGSPDKWNVTVTGQNTADVTRPQYEIKHAQLKPNGSDGFFITGEIFNKSDQPIVIHNLAGAMLDKNKNIVAADTSSDYAVLLTPAGSSNAMDSSPFRINIDNPGGSPDQWATYVDAEVAPSIDTFDVKVAITNHYFDENDEYHLVGTVKNNSDKLLTTVLVGGLYDKDGVVLDAYAAITDVNIAAGETIPFDLNSFDNVNNNSDEADRLDSYTVQLDPYNTFPSSFESVLMQSDGDKYTVSGDTWTFNGEVKSTSDKPLSDITVIVEIFDDQNNLVAEDYDVIIPSGDSIAKGDVNPYSLDVYLKPGVDSSKFTFKTLVKGYIK